MTLCYSRQEIIRPETMPTAQQHTQGYDWEQHSVVMQLMEQLIHPCHRHTTEQRNGLFGWSLDLTMYPLADIKLAIQPKLVSKSQRSVCFPSTGIEGMHHQTWLFVVVLKIFFSIWFGFLNFSELHTSTVFTSFSFHPLPPAPSVHLWLLYNFMTSSTISEWVWINTTFRVLLVSFRVRSSNMLTADHLGLDNLPGACLCQQPVIAYSSSSRDTALWDFPIYTGLWSGVVTVQVLFIVSWVQ